MRLRPVQMLSCLLCDSSKYVVVGRRAAGGELRLTVVCRECGLVYVRGREKLSSDSGKHYSVPEPTPDHLAKSERRGAGIEEWIRSVCMRMNCGSPLSPATRLLDIGSGNGGVLKVFRDRYGSAVLGVEPDPDFARYANDVLGIRTLSAPLDTLSLEGTFDVILLSHAIMCFSRPDEILRGLAHLLAPGGVLYLSVGNYFRPKRLGGLEQYLFKPYACYYFTPLTLENLLHKSGFKTLAIDLASRGEVKVLAMPMSPDEARRSGTVRREHWVTVVLRLKLYDWLSACARVGRASSRLCRLVRARRWRIAK